MLRVSYARILKAQTFVENRCLKCYVPLRHKQIRKSGRNRIITEPLFPSFLFVHATRPQVDALLSDCKNAATTTSCTTSAQRTTTPQLETFSSDKTSPRSATPSYRKTILSLSSPSSIPLLSFYYDHTQHLESDPTKNPPLVIPAAEMDNFIRLTSISNPHIIPITSSHIHYKLGDYVLITEGEFQGIRGHIARIAGQQRVVVELFDGCFVGTAYVPKEMVLKC